MTKIIITLAMYLVSILCFSQEKDSTEMMQETVSIKVIIENVANDKGKILYALYDEKGFLSQTTDHRAFSLIKDGKAQTTFKNVPKGTYAIVCLHDSNDNGRMDFESNGMPLEDYGTSNNVMSYGPPQFNTAKFEVTDKDLTFEIQF